MIVNDKGYQFECSGKQLDVYGAFGFSLLDGNIRTGYDNDYRQYNHESEEVSDGLTEEEKKELAMFVISEWAKFGNIEISIKEK